MHKEKQHATIAAAVFSALSLLFLLLPSSPVVNSAKAALAFSLLPFVSAGHSAAEITAGAPRNIAALINAEEENRALRLRQKDADITAAQLEAALETNRRLAAETGLSASEKWRGVWARVMERDPAHWNSSFLVDRGASSGVQPHDPVLGVQDGRAGIVGKVVEVWRDSAKVLLATDEMFSAVCYVEGRNWDALAEGRGRAELRLNYLPSDANVEKGAKVFTSRSSVVFPQGILAGTIIGVHQAGSFQTFTSADLRLAVRPEAAKEVFIMSRNRPPAPAEQGAAK
ncbi:MAG: rod shape-determining protein MreC [Elusimicrobiales bacterium]